MRGGEHFGDASGCAFGLLKHGELVGPHGLIFVDTGFDVPAGEITAIGSRESSGAETADRGALPETVIDVSGVEGSFFCAGVLEWKADGPFPGGLGNAVVGRGERSEKSEVEGHNAGQCEPLDHNNSSTKMAGRRLLAGTGPASNAQKYSIKSIF